MSAAKHTPGPWVWSDKYPTSENEKTWSLLGADGFGILSCDGEANSPQNVNANDSRLIAAAPDLLDVACALIAFSFTSEVPLGEIQAKARAAIIKATGEQL